MSAHEAAHLRRYRGDRRWPRCADGRTDDQLCAHRDAAAFVDLRADRDPFSFDVESILRAVELTVVRPDRRAVVRAYDRKTSRVFAREARVKIHSGRSIGTDAAAVVRADGHAHGAADERNFPAFCTLV